MFTIRQLLEFENWLKGLRDKATRIRLARRLEKAQRGNLGDVKPVGDGVFEMREFFGPGWRMYYTERDGTIIVMLGGGNKSTQKTHIGEAIVLAKTLQDSPS